MACRWCNITKSDMTEADYRRVLATGLISSAKGSHRHKKGQAKKALHILADLEEGRL